MAIEGKKIEKTANSGDQFIVTFSNGSVEQLEELRGHFNLDGLLDVVKIGVSFLQKLKDEKMSTDTPTRVESGTQGMINKETPSN